VTAEILSISKLYAGYGPVEVLKGISLHVCAGEIVTIIGANGAGKTTLLRCISRLIPTTTGTLSFDGLDLSALDAHLLPGRGLAHVPEGRQIFSRLTVLENLELGAYSRAKDAVLSAEYDKIFSLFPVLKERRSQLGGTLSGGEQQMLAIGRALMGAPRLLLMDEPSMGVAPLLVEKIFLAIQELNALGMTIVLVEQNAHLALSLAKRGYVLETGEIALEGPTASLKTDPRVREAYLGE
jgi:branched-chain amino acid transport system ATP-binding protein